MLAAFAIGRWQRYRCARRMFRATDVWCSSSRRGLFALTPDHRRGGHPFRSCYRGRPIIGIVFAGFTEAEDAGRYAGDNCILWYGARHHASRAARHVVFDSHFPDNRSAHAGIEVRADPRASATLHRYQVYVVVEKAVFADFTLAGDHDATEVKDGKSR